MYNVAMIQQKAAELLFGLPPAKRSLNDLSRAITQATLAQRYAIPFTPKYFPTVSFLEPKNIGCSLRLQLIHLGYCLTV